MYAVNRTKFPHLVGQQHVPDLSQILLGEDKAHISFNVGKEPVKSYQLLLTPSVNFHKEEKLLIV